MTTETMTEALRRCSDVPIPEEVDGIVLQVNEDAFIRDFFELLEDDESSAAGTRMYFSEAPFSEAPFGDASRRIHQLEVYYSVKLSEWTPW